MRLQRLACSVAACLLVLSFSLSGAGAVQAAGHARAQQLSAVTVVKGYFNVLDADLKTADFSNLGMAYAENATLKVTDANGVAEEYHGLKAIMKYWKLRGVQVPGLHFTADRIVSLDMFHVAAFERTSTKKNPILAGRCAHLFNVRGNKIIFDAYFGVALTKSEVVG